MQRVSNKVGFKLFGSIAIVTLLRDGETALIHALAKNHEKIADLLLERGADIHATDR